MFTQKISMDCTRQQYEEHLRDALLKMGYKEVDFGYNTNLLNIVVNNYKYTLGDVSNLGEDSKSDNSRLYLGSFNPELFLAYAAMTDKEFGGYGEWWMCIKSLGSLELGGFYTAIEVFKDKPPHLMDSHNRLHLCDKNSFFSYFRKATTDEINEKFGRRKTEPEPTLNNITEECIAHLKAKGYKILRKVENWEEV